MPPFAAAITAVLAYTGMNILFKRHSGAGGSALALTAWLGLLAPVWGLMLALTAPTHLIYLPPQPAYWALSLLWAVLLPATTWLMLHLLHTLSLIELTAARKALTTLLALAADTLLLHTHFTAPTLLAVTVITAAALLLPGPTKRADTHRATTLATRFLWLLGLSALLTLQLLAYKKALAYQPDLLSHIIIVKLLAALACLPLFLFIPKAQRQRPGALLTLGVLACYLLGSIAEGYALQGLPLTILIAVTTATAALMAAHDLWRKDLPATKQSAILLALIFAGFVLLALSR